MNLEEQNFRTWLDKYFDLFPNRNPIIVSFIGGLGIYLLGLIISIIGGFTWLYIETYQHFLTIFGIIWVAGWMHWGHLELFQIINAYPFSLDDSEDEDFKAALSTKLKLGNDHRLLLTISLLLTLSFYVFIIGFWFLEEKFLGLRFYIPPFISKEWFTGDSLILKAFTLLFLSTPVGFLIGTSGTQIVIYNLNILTLLSRHFDSGPLFLLPQKLKPITRLNLRAAYSWFVGVALGAVVAYKRLTPLSLSYLVAFSAVGLLLFFVPQIIFHRVLEKKKTTILEKIGAKCEGLFRKMGETTDINEMEKVQYLCNLSLIYQTTRDSPTWILDVKVLTKLITSSITPIVAVFGKMLITKWMGKSI